MTEQDRPKKEKNMGVLDELKKLDERRAALLDKAKEEAMGKVTEALADLNAIGFNYSLTENGKRKRTASAAGRVCGVCGESGHNARTCPKKGKK